MTTNLYDKGIAVCSTAIPPNLFFSSSASCLSFALTANLNNRNPFKFVSRKTYELYKWRVKAHKVFDKLFVGTEAVMTKREAYEYLQYLMGLSEEQAHIGNFDIEQCKELIDLLEFQP
ncbi:MAG: zinc-finger-containing protein [Blastocatellia bacterium]